MGRPGRREKDTRAAKFAGTHRTSRADWVAPRHLSEIARAAWDYIVDRLDQHGDLERTDHNVVEAYAVNVSVLRTAQEAIAKDGQYTIGIKGALVAHPAIDDVNAATIRIKSIAYDLGLMPRSSRLSSSPS